jgi:hypothetical protein
VPRFAAASGVLPAPLRSLLCVPRVAPLLAKGPHVAVPSKGAQT